MGILTPGLGRDVQVERTTGERNVVPKLGPCSEDPAACESEGPADAHCEHWMRERAIDVVPHAGRWQASFRRRIAGVSRASADALDSECLRSVLARLRFGQRVIFQCTTRHDQTGFVLDYSIAGAADASSRNAAFAAGSNLLDEIVLAARSADTVLRPDIERLPREPSHAAYLLEPAGWRVSVHRRRDTGFRAFPSRGGTRHLILPAGDMRGFTEDVIDLLRRWPSAIDIALVVQPGRLRSPEVELLSQIRERAMDAARPWPLERRRDRQIVELGPERMQMFQAHAVKLAGSPLLRVACVVDAADSVSSAFLDQVARYCYGAPLARSPHVDVSTNRVGPLPIPAARSGDLRTALVLDSPGVRFAPPTKSLLWAGASRIFVHPPRRLPQTGIAIGRAKTASGQSVAVRFEDAAAALHILLCGATGTGKSSLVATMADADIKAGRGVCVIDPHGDLYAQVLASVPSSRHDDVIVVDPGVSDRAIGLNLLECREPHDAAELNFVVNEMVNIIGRMYDLTTVGGPVFEQYLRYAFLLVIDSRIPGGTLLDVPRVFEDAAYRRALIRACRNEAARSFWENVADRATGDLALANMAAYVTSKLNQFTASGLLRPIVGQARSTLDFRDVMNDRRILLVNLAKGGLGELDSRLVGMIVIGKLFAAALGRAREDAGRRVPFRVYVDEFQNFTTSSLPAMLAEARKFGLSLTLATQTLSALAARQHTGDVLLDAVLGNCGNFVFFRTGPQDAERVAPLVAPEFTARDLQELPNYSAAARLLVDGVPERPFLLTTMSCGPFEQTTSQRIGRTVGDRHARSHAEIEADIAARVARVLDSGSHKAGNVDGHVDERAIRKRSSYSADRQTNE